MSPLFALYLSLASIGAGDAADTILRGGTYQTELPTGAARAGGTASGAPAGGAAGETGRGGKTGRTGRAGPQRPTGPTRKGERGGGATRGDPTGEGSPRDRTGEWPAQPPTDDGGPPLRDSPSLGVEPEPGGTAMPGAIRALAKLASWALIAAAVIALLVFIVRAVASYEPDVSPHSEQAPARPGPLREERTPVPDWQAFASGGRYAEAIHGLLLDAYARLPKQARDSLVSSWTSREILTRVRLEPEPEGALSRLVRAVESCHFGGRPASRQLFDSCLQDHRRIAASQGR